MRRPAKLRHSLRFTPFVALIAATLCLASSPLSLRNTLRAEDLSAESINTVAEMDSLFLTFYNPEVSPGKGTGWKPFNRMHWFYRQRAFPSGNIPATARMDAWQQKQNSRGRNSLDETWTLYGPANMAGRILSIAWHPTNTNIIYVGSASGGLWKTTNGGSSWTPLTDNLPSLAIGVVALDPSHPDTVYIGTGEGSFNIDAVYGAGIFKSTDGGATWNTTGMSWTQSQTRAVNDIIVHPTNPQILWAATNIASSGGVYKSTDGGASWTRTLAGDAKDLVIHPDSANVLYAGIGYPWGNSANGIYKSADGGVTWTLCSTGLPSAYSMGRMELTISRSSSQTLYAGISQPVSSGAGLLGIYKTTDGGASWTSQSTSPNMYGGQGWYNIVCEVHPTNPAIVFSSGLDCYKSTNSGVAWTQKSYWYYSTGHSQYAHADHHALAFKPGDPNTILVGTDGGVFKSTNGGDTWTGLNSGLVTFQFYGMGDDRLTPNTVYGGTQDNGTDKGTGSTTWSAILGGDGGYCNVDFTNSNVVYATTQNGAHYKSTNGGGSFYSIQTGISGSGAWVTPRVMDPSNSNVLYTGTTMVYKTTNGGTNWTAISSALSTQDISTIAVAPSNPQVIYVGYEYNGQVWKTTDGGTNWTSVSSGLPYRYITRVRVHPSDPNTVYVTVSGYGTGHVWKSTNGGSSWSNSSSGLPDIPCNSIVIDSNTPTTLYVGTDLGVYVSTNGGSSWVDYSNGLPNVVVADLALHPTTGMLRAATHGRGMWQTPTSTPSVAVLSPNGGESWVTTTSQTITWSTGGLGGNVKLELNRSYPSGAWEVITNSTGNDGSYGWTVTSPATGNARVRVTSVETPAATDVSNGDFSITQPQLTVLAPNGGETCVVGASQTISWNLQGASGNVVVQINRNYPSASWTTLATVSGSSYAWTVTTPASSTCRIRAYLQSAPTIGDTSNADFFVVEPTVTVSTPNGGESLTPGSVHVVRWTAQYYTGSVKVELNRSYPSGTWETLAATVTADSLRWTVDQFGATAARVRVTANAYTSATDISNANFTILTPSLAVATPNGGEVLVVGGASTLRWSRANLMGPVNVHLNTNYPGGTWNPIAVSVTVDTFRWTVSKPFSNTARIRVTSVNLPSYYDESNASFVVGNGIVMETPEGGENWAIGLPQTISWTRYNASGAATVQINRNYPSGAWETVTTGVTGSTYSWTVTGPGSSTARMRVYVEGSPSLSDTSDSEFTIPVAGLAITSPNGGELWTVGSQQTVTWTRNGANGNVTVQINRNYPTGAWEVLTTTVTTSSYSWTVTGPGSSNARVEVHLTSSPTVNDMSNADFSIGTPQLTLLAPNGGETWLIGAAQTIRWSRQYASGDVRVLLNRTYPGGSWETLASAVSADSLVWSATGTASSSARVRIYLVSSSSVADTSAGNFTLALPTITVVSPNGGESWLIGAAQTITFTRSNAEGDATVQVNRNYPSGAWETITTTATGTSVPWTPSGSASAACRVRVFLNWIPSARDSSNANFTLSSASLAIQTPNAGEQLGIGSNTWIKWARSGAPGPVSVAVNRSYPSGTWESLSSSVSTDSFLWTITGPATGSARVRVTLNSNPTVTDVSDANFTIVQPALSLSAPNGGETYTLGGPITMRWSRIAAPGAVAVLLNRNYPSGTWETLNASVTTDSFVWTSTGAASSVCRVKIRLASDTTVSDFSSANFSIVERVIELTSHNGGETYYTGSSSSITFTRTQAAGNVTVQLNRNFPAGAWETLSSTVSASSYAWSVSGTPSGSARVRIFLTSETIVGDTSAANFTIAVPALVLLSPNGGETLTVGNPYVLRWLRYGAAGQARVELKRSWPSGTWETLGTTTADSLVWLTSGSATSTARVRIYLVSQTATCDTSASNFVIAQPPLVLNSPLGGEHWPEGTDQTIAWTRSGFSGSVRVELSENYPASPWTTLATGQTGSSWVWHVAAALTDHARVRIIGESQPQYSDTSGDFSIVTAALTMISPNGGEELVTGTPYTITFSRANHPEAARVELNRDWPSGSWTTLVSGVTASSVVWTATGPTTMHARFRVMSEVYSAIGDTSDAEVNILAPGITLIAPVAGDSIGIGMPLHFSWRIIGYPPGVNLYLKRNWPSGSWELLALNVPDTAWTWTTSGSASNTARFRILSASTPSQGDTTDGPIRIGQPQLAFASPTNSDTFLVGAEETIRWTRHFTPGEVRVEVSRNGTAGPWEEIGRSSSDSLIWSVTGPATTDARLRVSLTEFAAASTVTSFGLVVAVPSLAVMSPQDGESHAIGRSLTITWTRNAVSDPVDVYVRRSTGGALELLQAGVAGDSYAWNPTGPAASAARIVLQTNGVVPLEAQSGEFVLGVPTITLTSPVGGETFVADSTMHIRWQRAIVNDPVRIELNRSYPSTAWSVLADAVSDTVFDWRVIGPTTGSARLRVVSVIDSALADTTASNFSILVPELSMDEFGRERVPIGFAIEVSWMRTAVDGPVELYLSRDGGVTWPEQVANGLEGSSYEWRPLPPASDEARLKVQSASQPSIFGLSDVFTLAQPRIAMNHPSGGDTLPQGEAVTIRWTRTDHPAGVDVLFNSNAPSGPWQLLADDLDADSLAWTPSVTCTGAKLRVRSAVDSSWKDESATFAVLARALHVVSPLSGSELVIGDSLTIQWQRIVHAAPVRVLLRRLAGATDTLTPSTLASAVGIAVQGPPAEQSWLVVENAVSGLPRDSVELLGPYEPAITIAEPASGERWIADHPATIRWSRAHAEGEALVRINYGDGVWEDAGATWADSLVYIPEGDETDSLSVAIVLLARPNVADTVSGVRVVRPGLSLHELTESEYRMGAILTALWTNHEVEGDVRLDLNRSYPVGEWEVLYQGGMSSFDWVVSGDTTSTARLRVLSVEDETVGDTLAQNLVLYKPHLALSLDPPADTLFIGRTVNFLLELERTEETADLFVQREDGGVWELVLSDLVGGVHPWIVTGPAAVGARFRASVEGDPELSDTTDAVTLVTPQLAFVFPIESGVDTVGSVLGLEWQWLEGSDDVRLEVNTDSLTGSWHLLADSLSVSHFDYAVTGPETDSLRFRVRSIADPNVYALSAVRSVVQPALVLQVTGGETWYIGEQKWLRWTRMHYGGEVTIEATAGDRALPWEHIADVVADSFLWTVAGPVSDFVALRVSAAGRPDVNDTTDSPLRFAQPFVQIVEPNGGEVLDVGQEIRLRWTAAGFAGGMNIGLWRGEPVNRLDTLFLNTANDSSEIWAISGPPAQDCRLIITSAVSEALWDTSDGGFEIRGGSSANDNAISLPREFSLSPPYPNPFNRSANIEFALPRDGPVRVVVFDLLGREVATLVDETRRAGVHRVAWNANAAASGVYFVRMNSADFVATRKLHLIK